MTFTLQRLRVLLLAKDVLIELHVDTKKVLEPRFDSLSILQHFFADVISIDVNTDRAYDSKFLSLDWNRGAFEFSYANIQIVIQFVFVEQLAAFEINEQIRCSVTQMPSCHIVFERDEGVRWVGKVMQQDLDPSVRKGFSDQAHNPLIVFQEFVRVVGDGFAVIFLE